VAREFFFGGRSPFYCRQLLVGLLLLKRLGWARHAAAIVLFRLLNAVRILTRLEPELANWLLQALKNTGRCSTCLAILFSLFIELTLLTGELLLFAQRAFARTRDLASWRQTRLGEALLRREIIVFDKRTIVGVMEFVEKPISYETDLTFCNLCGNWLKLRWLFHDVASGSHVADLISDGVLRLG
jgi:hypothetical protein